MKSYDWVCTECGCADCSPIGLCDDCVLKIFSQYNAAIKLLEEYDLWNSKFQLSHPHLFNKKLQDKHKQFLDGRQC